MENGIIYFKGTDDEFADDPECWYKKYDIDSEELTDISESDIPEDYVPLKERGLSSEEIGQYKSLTGSEGGLNAIYHDHLIFTDVKLIDGEFITTIQIYDYEGNFQNEIKGPEYVYLGCDNDNLLFIDSEDTIQMYPLS